MRPPLVLLTLLCALSSSACNPVPATAAPVAQAPGPTAPQPAAPQPATPQPAAPQPSAAATSPTDAPPPVVLPIAWQRCRADRECTFVALGCCDTTPVLRKHAAEANERLVASGRPECPVKAACGPGADGTWIGTAGACIDGRCGCDPAAPLFANCRGE
ncbi:MAG: hypothetical protein K1X88_02215 [Nannocystaceae bacterium]|nr:hypothetical protein [Nannocystaceae bacterium]